MNRAAIFYLLFITSFIACITAAKAQLFKQPGKAAQKPLPQSSIAALSGSFGRSAVFTEQIGQYAADTALEQFGKIHAGFEGFSAPVLFTEKGVIFLQKKKKNFRMKRKNDWRKKVFPKRK